MRSLPIAFLLLPGLTTVAHAQDRSHLQGRDSPLQVAEQDDHDRELRMTPVVRAVQKAADSVVSIYIQHENAFAGRQPVTEGQGSGVILDDSGFVITNWHVIAPVVLADGYTVEIKLKDGRARAAKVLSSSPTHDLALLQLQLRSGEKVKPVSIGRSADLMVGETTIAIGNPQGHANTVTQGVLSATGRSIKVMAPDGVGREYSGLLQTDAAINQGNSGGALLDITGKLIGINNAMAGAAQNIGFAIPVDTVREVFEKELIQSFAAGGDAAWLGMQVQDSAGKVLVTAVEADGPAAQAGVAAGDVLARIGDTEVHSALDYARRVLTAAPARPFALQVLRGNRRLDLLPVPLSRAAGNLIAMTGLSFEEVTADQDRELLQKASRAFYKNSNLRRFPLAVLRVQHVQAGSPAADLGIEQGDVLLAVVGYDRFRGERELSLDSLHDFEQYLRQNQNGTVKVTILRGKELLDGQLDVRRLTKL